MSIVTAHVPVISSEQSLPERGVAATLELIAEGATVPFIARYRKERTGGLDEVQIRAIAERYDYLDALEQRRQTILKSIDEQGQLTDALRRQILGCSSKVDLEDLYLPYKPKRRTRATMARERGLEPLAQQILQQAGGDPFQAAGGFVAPDKEVPDVDAALAGARDIVAEQIAETAPFRTYARETTWRYGTVDTKAARGKAGERSKFEQYYDFSEPVRAIPSHRLLAILRGEREKMLSMSVVVEPERVEQHVLRQLGHRPNTGFGRQLELATNDSLQRLLLPSVSKEILADLKSAADLSAVDVFATNLRNLLLSAPLGQRNVVGIDPGLRTGCKCAAVDATGRYLDTVTIYPTQNADRAEAELHAYLKKHQPDAIAVGNGTGGRETMALVRKVVKAAGLDTLVVEVNEAGASVYSASDVARAEYPELDLTVRGAISIAHRLQDPLAELVKIDPKSIGVGQYQHDVHQPLLHKKLGDVVEDCVNQVGVVLNTASAPLLAHVAGIGPKLSSAIVAHRDQNGAFRRRRDLLKVAGLGPKTFEQAAGFLRVPDSSHPLDASAVHPERYGVVEQMAKDLGVSVGDLVGNEALVKRIALDQYVDASAGLGLPTLTDIATELLRPGRDPRSAFEAPAWRDDIQTIADLREGMTLTGVVTNVTHFGAFVDLGVHQDGLVHISELADRFVKDPAEVVKVGDKLDVRVLQVDVGRKRISLSARKEPRAGQGDGGGNRSDDRGGPPRRRDPNRNDPRHNSPQRGQGRNDRQNAGPKRSGGGNRGGGNRGNNRGGDRGGDRRGGHSGGGSGGKLTHNPFADLLKRD